MFSVKSLSLILISFQTTALVLLLRYSRSSHAEKYIISTAVLLSEILKLSLSLFILVYEEGFGVYSAAVRFHREIIIAATETLKLSIPAGLYVIQNNLLYVALSNLDAATYQVTYQLKILTTAIFSKWLLGKQLNFKHWSSLLALVFGVSLVQMAADNDFKGKSGFIEDIDDIQEEGLKDRHDLFLNPVVEEDTVTFRKMYNDTNSLSSWLIGIIAVFVSCISSGFSGVYFERLVKKNRQTSLVIRNIQLGLFSIIFCIIAVLGDRTAISDIGFFHGYNIIAWIVIIMQAVGGLIVSLTMKYADNILKCFATSLSIVMSSIFSWLVLNDSTPSIQFAIGALVVIISTFTYGLMPPAGKWNVDKERISESKNRPFGLHPELCSYDSYPPTLGHDPKKRE